MNYIAKYIPVTITNALKLPFIAFSALVFPLILIRKFCKGPQANKIRDMTGKVIIITGSSSGIGKEIARQMLKQGGTVVFACRNKEKTEKVIKKLTRNEKELKNAHFLELNLSDIKSIEVFALNFKKQFGKLDVLVNNAGIIHGNFKLNKQNIEEIVGCIFIGHLILTSLLKDCFNEEARLINATSHLFELYQPDFKDFENDLDFVNTKNNYSMFKQYVIAKTGITCLTKYMTSYFKKMNKNVKSLMVHPGWVHTSGQRNIGIWWLQILYFTIGYPLLSYFFKSEKDGAQTHIQAINEDFDKVKENSYYYDCCQRDFPKFINREIMFRYLSYAKNLIYYKNGEENLKKELKDVLEQIPALINQH